ncbi:hypothetical protein RP20_CCG002787 [Aedes albopictus]|nr:hypothetical protein RP20_CCG002787 [Aedes albopictus]
MLPTEAGKYSMVHRLYNVPMDKTEFDEEKSRIYKAAEVNGYDKRFIEKILQKHKRKKQRQDITTLQPNTQEVKRISLPFYPKTTNPIKNTLQRQGQERQHTSGPIV